MDEAKYRDYEEEYGRVSSKHKVLNVSVSNMNNAIFDISSVIDS